MFSNSTTFNLEANKKGLNNQINRLNILMEMITEYNPDRLLAVQTPVAQKIGEIRAVFNKLYADIKHADADLAATEIKMLRGEYKSKDFRKTLNELMDIFPKPESKGFHGKSNAEIEQLFLLHPKLLEKKEPTLHDSVKNIADNIFANYSSAKHALLNQLTVISRAADHEMLSNLRSSPRR